MATQPQSLLGTRKLELKCIARFPRMRALAWDRNVLYASRGYELLQTKVDDGPLEWRTVGHYQPAWWRKASSASRLSFRLFRDGFHALAVLPNQYLVAAVPKAIVALAPGGSEFHVTHHIRRGTRPLHIAYAPNGHLYWGEYFDNAQRDEVYIYASTDHGLSWNVAYTFPKGAIRHVHNIVYDEWENCLWVLTGDEAAECRILKASLDFRSVEEMVSSNQQARAVALIPTCDALYFSSDTPLEQNNIYRLDRRGNLVKHTALSSSSIYGCRVGEAVFFSTMIEPTKVNRDYHARLYGSWDRVSWQSLLAWKKDIWPMGLFQFGNVFLPDGVNTSNILALTTLAVQAEDLQTSLWSVEPSVP